MKEGWFATNTKVMFFILVKTTSFTFVENYLGHYWFKIIREMLRERSLMNQFPLSISFLRDDYLCHAWQQL